MVQSKEFVDASHALNDLSHALALLESENASLRGDVDVLCNENASLRGDVDVLCNENAKLRELVSGLEYCSQGFVCDGCPLYDASNTNHHGCESLERELGIEVD